MRLDFNVLWVEDNHANVQAQKERIAQLLRGEGFRLCPEFVPSVEAATALLTKEIYQDHVDLVLMDYDLGIGMRGDDGLLEVRRFIPYRDIVFYSGASTRELRERVAQKKVEGVFVSNRLELPTAVQGVFENLIRKTLDIDHARGIAMGALSEIEYAIDQALSKVFNMCDEDHMKVILDNVRSGVSSKRSRYAEALDKIEAVSHLDELGNDHSVFTVYDRVILLRKVLKSLNLHLEHLQKFVDYEQKVIPRRNELAHIRVERNGFARTFYDKKDKEIRSDDMRDFRIKLLEFEELMKKLFVDGETPVPDK